MFETGNCGRRYQFISTPTTVSESLGIYLASIKLPSRNCLKSKGNFLNYTDSTDFARMKRLSLKTKKINGIQKIDLNKKKSIDYTEMAYREAVSKLKYLLTESYTSKPITGKAQGIKDIYLLNNTKVSESEEETDDRSTTVDNPEMKDLHKDINPHFASCRTIHQAKAFSSSAFSSTDIQSVPPELSSFIEQQEEYIRQLQQESQFCRNQLTNLLHKVREVIAENETLHYKNKTGFFKCALDEYVHINEHVSENNKQKTIQTDIIELKKPKMFDCPNIVFESRISELEAQLTQAKLELRKAQEENQINLKRLSESCLNTDVLDIKVELEKALHAKREAEIKIEDLQKSLALVRNKETEAAGKVKQTADAMQQIEFEKNQCETEIKRLKTELDRQHEKFREANKRLAEERQQAERRYSQQVEQLSVDVASHWDAASKSQLESEKQRRELTELRRELSQRQTFVDNLKKELQNKISNLQSDLNQALTEKDVAEQEVLTTRLAAERNERQNCQEQNRLQIEINSYKQRLERTEADLVHFRRENVRLSEQIASLEKEINSNKSICPDNFSVQSVSKSENEKELASMTMDMETKHAATVASLEDALNNQAMIVSQLNAECQSLTQRLEANNLKHNYSVLTEGVTDRDVTRVGKTTSASNKKRTVKVDLKVKVIPKQKEEMANLQSNIEYLSDKIQSTFTYRQDVTSAENKNESSISYSHNTAPNSAIEAQNIIIPRTVNQEYDINTNKSNQETNKVLDNIFCYEREYDTKNETVDDIEKTMQKREQNANQNSELKNITEQHYNSYKECDAQNDQPEYTTTKEISNEIQNSS